MTLQKKITITFFILLFGLPLYGWWYVRHNRPHVTLPPPRPEITITIIPGWNLTDIANYLVKQEIADSTTEVYRVTGAPAVESAPAIVVSSTILTNKPKNESLEGYLAPETYRIFKDATIVDVVEKLLNQRSKELGAINFASSGHTLHEALTMASIVEEEARTPEDRRLVADILWRRYAKNWALQVDSSVHYAVHKSGTVFTTESDRKVSSLWNTYKYPGLPPSPICNPSSDAVEAALQPTRNDYWYFLSGSDGVMHYAKTLDEQTANRYKYLR